ncbi:MAG: RNA polymerase sigma factor [Pseudomonadota bacterium]
MAMHYLQPDTPKDDVQSSDPVDGPGDNSRLTSVFERIRSRLTIWLEREFGSGPPHPEDVVQQTFAKLAAHGDLGSIKYLETYAWTTALNFVRHEKRAQAVAESYADDSRKLFWHDEYDAFDPERIVLAKEELEIVARTLQQMPERRRSIFMACRFEGLSQEEAGKRAGVSRTSAMRHLAKATDMIVKALSAGDDQPASGEQNDAG